MVLRLLLLISMTGLLACQRQQDALPPSDLTISTFNLKWYGLRKDNEFRDPYLKQFIQQELNQSDVIAFTEVVQVERLKQLVSYKWDCVGYQEDRHGHQHVAICYDRNKFHMEPLDADYVVEEVRMGSRGLRPAVNGMLCHNNRDQACFLHVIGVHLKAGPYDSKKRIKQIELLSQELKTLETVPTVIIGDFNAYQKDRSKLPKDDLDYMYDHLNTTGQSYVAVSKDIPTYNHGEFGRDYDHVVISDHIQLLNVKAYPACGKNPDPRERFLPYNDFRKYLSDHCPLTARLKVGVE